MNHQHILDYVIQRNLHEPEFIQAVEEVALSIMPVIERNPEYGRLKILERILEPERLISFRVSWLDDKGEAQVNRGYRVQMNSAIGPYKGGLRFHPSVTQSVLKFLAFEQVFKNALTGIPMGGGKGGSDFDPKGKSDNEVMKFCQAFMGELARHIGHRLDVPAGDIGVGGREIGYLFGAYKKIKNEFTGVLTGKGIGWGGSLIRPEATGYGLIYFAENMLQTKSDSIKGKTCWVSGSGNVYQYAIEKINHLGGKAVTASDSNGFIYDEAGISGERLQFLMDLKNIRRGRIKEYADKFKCTFTEVKSGADHNPLWKIKADCAFPCATQNEVNEKDAVTITLKPGEMSLHHVRLVHGSPPNPSDDRRIGFAIRYIPTTVAQVAGDDSATLVRGFDEHHHFAPEPRPTRDMDPAFVALHKQIAERNAQILYRGTAVKSYNDPSALPERTRDLSTPK